jgi:hypothetical protein
LTTRTPKRRLKSLANLSDEGVKNVSKKRDLKAFVEAVKATGIAEDLSRAARHHSAANVEEGDAVLHEVQRAEAAAESKT